MNEKQTGRSLQNLLQKWAQATVDLADAVRPPAYHGRDYTLTNLVEHTGEVVAGSCFVARVRTGSDGHPYIGTAVDAGATVIIGQRPRTELDLTLPDDVAYIHTADSAAAMAWLAAAWHDFPSRELNVIGVTGTDGKTSTSNILYDLLHTAGRRVGMISTIRAVFGDEEEPTGLHVTTPGAPQVQAYLRRMVDAGLTDCILETTSHGLAQHRVTAVDFNVGVVTNITHEHLDYHGSYEAYFAAKARLFRMVRRRAGTAVLNRADGSYDGLAAIADRAVTYGTPHADVFADDVTLTATETRLRLHWPAAPQGLPVTVPLVGRFNVANLQAAVAAAHVLGLSPAEMERGLSGVRPITGRMERIAEGQDFLAIVDFAHTPNALANALDAARPLAAARGGRVIAVFGSAGKRDVEKRRLMAEVSAQKADVTVLTAEDPRTESLADILEMMAAGCRMHGGVEGRTFWRVPDRGEAIYFACTVADAADVVVVCGKGHEQSMCFGTIEYPWDDRDATRAALRAYLAGRPMPDLGLPTFSNG